MGLKRRRRTLRQMDKLKKGTATFKRTIKATRSFVQAIMGHTRNGEIDNLFPMKVTIKKSDVLSLLKASASILS